MPFPPSGRFRPGGGRCVGCFGPSLPAGAGRGQKQWHGPETLRFIPAPRGLQEFAITTVEEPLSYSYDSANWLALPLTVPKVPAGRGCTTSPSLHVDALARQLRASIPPSVPLFDEATHLRLLSAELRELEGEPLWRVDPRRRTRLLRGVEALETLVPGDWRARVVVRYARKLARRPEEVLHLLTKISPVQLPKDLAEACLLCGEEDPLTWWGNWCCSRRARRQVGSGRICACCVEHFEG